MTSEADCWRGHRWEWVGFWLTVPLTGSVAASERHRWRVERMEHGAGTISDNKWYGFRTVVACETRVLYLACGFTRTARGMGKLGV